MKKKISVLLATFILSNIPHGMFESMRKKKGFLLGVLTLLMLLSAVPLFKMEARAETSGDYEYWISGNEVGITKYLGSGGDVVIPSEIEGGKVLCIQGGAFQECSGLTSVSIPEGVTAIESKTFSGCSNLTSVSIPQGVTTIGFEAFRNCKNLTNINIPEGVTMIESQAFMGCSNLANVSLPSSLTSIKINAFAGCINLANINIPEGITSIENGVFTSCGFTSVRLPDGVTSIGDNAFAACSNLKEINIPEGATSIGLQAFDRCESLTSITIPGSVTSIGMYAFRQCTSLTDVNIPGSVTSIGEEAFVSCDSLASVSISAGVESIGERAFGYSLSGLKKSDFIIYGTPGTAAETYAIENGFGFNQALDSGSNSGSDSNSGSNPGSDAASSVYEVDVTNREVISSEQFNGILEQNKTQDVVIKSNNGVTFKFLKGTMQAVDGKESYNFGNEFITDFNQAGNLPQNVTSENFVFEIIYHYSGKLPADAWIRLPAGAQHAGKLLSYSLFREDGTLEMVGFVKADADGYVTVKQSHCSTYIMTKMGGSNAGQTYQPGSDFGIYQAEPSQGNGGAGQSGQKAPKTKDSREALPYVVIAVSLAGLLLVNKKQGAYGR